jgi:hypothetical protein
MNIPANAPKKGSASAEIAKGGLFLRFPDMPVIAGSSNETWRLLENLAIFPRMRRLTEWSAL